LTLIASYQDPLKKREEFAVSLRKKKTHEIINAKRRRLVGSYSDDLQGPEHVQACYKGYQKFEQNQDEYNKTLNGLCPQYVADRTYTLVLLSKSHFLGRAGAAAAEPPNGQYPH